MSHRQSIDFPGSIKVRECSVDNLKISSSNLLLHCHLAYFDRSSKMQIKFTSIMSSIFALALSTGASVLPRQSGSTGKSDEILMQMTMRQNPTAVSEDLGQPIDIKLPPSAYDWGHGGCLKFKAAELVDSALKDTNTSFVNNDEITDWLVNFENVDPTCTVGVYMPNTFLTDIPYSEQADCGQLQYKIDQNGRDTRIPMQFTTDFGLQFCCGVDDCAAMLPANDQSAPSSSRSLDVKIAETHDGCPAAHGKHKKDSPVQYGPAFQVPGKNVYASQWIDCSGQSESCSVAAIPILTETKGTMSSVTSAAGTGLQVGGSTKLKWWIGSTTITAMSVNTYTYTKAIQKDHSRAKTESTYYTFYCRPGQSCAILFTPRASAREVSQCMKDGTLRKWIEYENVLALGPTGQQEVQGEYSMIYRN